MYIKSNARNLRYIEKVLYNWLDNGVKTKKDAESFTESYRKYKASSLLIVDDLFKGKINEVDINIIFEIINYRYMNNLPIIVSSEFTAERLLYFDERVGSRIIEMCKDYTVEILGKENNFRIEG